MINKTWKNWGNALEKFKFNEALISVWELIGFCDKYIENERPWEKSKKPTGRTQQKEAIGNLLLAINEIAKLLQPFLPETSAKILKQLKTEPPFAEAKVKMRTRFSSPIKKGKPLFPRI